jgi:cold shock CspA family protein
MEKQHGMVVMIRTGGFGYIQPSDSNDTNDAVFYHAAGLLNIDFKDLREGMEVTYQLISYRKKGKELVKAVNVEVIQ